LPLRGGQAAAQAIVWEENPDDAPADAHRSGREEGRVPSPTRRDCGDQNWRNEEAGVRARVEKPGRESTLLGRKPLGRGLDRGREVTRLTQAEEDTRDAEAKHACDQRVAQRGAAPNQNRERVARLRAQPVDHSSGKQEPDTVRNLKPLNHMTVVQVVLNLVLGIHPGYPAHEAEVELWLDE